MASYDVESPSNMSQALLPPLLSPPPPDMALAEPRMTGAPLLIIMPLPIMPLRPPLPPPFMPLRPLLPPPFINPGPMPPP